MGYEGWKQKHEAIAWHSFNKFAQLYILKWIKNLKALEERKKERAYTLLLTTPNETVYTTWDSIVYVLGENEFFLLLICLLFSIHGLKTEGFH